MAAFSIRNIDEDVKERLRLRAAKNGRSVEAEDPRGILVEAVHPPQPSAGLFGTLLERFGDLGGVELALPPRTTAPRAASLAE